MAEVIENSYTIYVSNCDGSLCISDLVYVLSNGMKKVVILKKGERIPDSVRSQDIDLSVASGCLKDYINKGFVSVEVHQNVLRTENPAVLQKAESQVDAKVKAQDEEKHTDAPTQIINVDVKEDKQYISKASGVSEIIVKDEPIVISAADKEKKVIKEILPEEDFVKGLIDDKEIIMKDEVEIDLEEEYKKFDILKYKEKLKFISLTNKNDIPLLEMILKKTTYDVIQSRCQKKIEQLEG